MFMVDSEEIEKKRKNLSSFIENSYSFDGMEVNGEALSANFKLEIKRLPKSSKILGMYDKISKRLLNFSPNSTKWAEEEKILLIWIVIRYCLVVQKDFEEIVDPI